MLVAPNSLKLTQVSMGKLYAYMIVRSRMLMKNLGLSLSSIKRERGRVDAVAQTTRFGAIVKHMAEMRVAAATQDFRALHTVPRVYFINYTVGLAGLPKAGPSAT